MAAFDIDNLWWLKNDTSRVGAEALQGLQIGANIAANRANQRLKEFDLQNERIRLQSIMDAKLAQQASQTARAQGLAEISSYMAQVASAGAWETPEAEAGFWKLAAKYPQAIERNDIDAMYNNTFGEAKRRSSMISRGGRGTVTEQDFNTWNTLVEDEENAITDESKAIAKQRRSMFERMKGIQTTSSGAPIEGKDYGYMEGEGGSKMFWYRTGRTGEPRFRNIPNEATQLNRTRFSSRMDMIEEAWRNYDPSMMTDGKLDPAKKEAQISQAYQEAFSKPQAEKKNNAIDTTPAGQPPTFPKYDPLTRKLIDPAGK